MVVLIVVVNGDDGGMYVCSLKSFWRVMVIGRKCRIRSALLYSVRYTKGKYVLFVMQIHRETEAESVDSKCRKLKDGIILQCCANIVFEN